MVDATISRIKGTIVMILLIALSIALYLVLVLYSPPSYGSGELTSKRKVIEDSVIKFTLPSKSKENFKRILKILFSKSKKISKEHVEEKFGIKVTSPSISEFQKYFQSVKISGLSRSTGS